MTAYLVANIDIHDPEGFARYSAGAGRIADRYRSRVLAGDTRCEVLEGDWNPRRLIIADFPTFEDAKRWHDSAEYRPFRELRERTATSQVVLIDGVRH